MGENKEVGEKEMCCIIKQKLLYSGAPCWGQFSISKYIMTTSDLLNVIFFLKYGTFYCYHIYASC